MRIGIVVDSACDLPGDFLHEHRIEILPITTFVDNDTFVDNRDPAVRQRFLDNDLGARSHAAETEPFSVEEIRDLFLRRLVVDKAIATAGSEIEGYISTRYRLPLPSVPELIRTWAVSIARYHLHLNGAPDHVVRDWKAAMDALGAVSAGKINLPFDDASQRPSDGAGRVTLVRPSFNYEGFL